MTRKQLKDVFEAIGIIAIVVSLVFLALEVRQSNLATLIAARDSAAQGHMDYLASAVDPTVLAVATSKTDPEDLTELERSQLTRYLRIRWRHYERLFFLYQSGVYSEAEWAGYRQALKNSLSIRPSGEMSINVGVWQDFKVYLSPDFVDYVEREFRPQVQ